LYIIWKNGSTKNPESLGEQPDTLIVRNRTERLVRFEKRNVINGIGRHGGSYVTVDRLPADNNENHRVDANKILLVKAFWDFGSIIRTT